MALGVLQSKKGRRARTVLLACVLFLLAWPLLAWVAARALVVRAELEQTDALVVMGGSSSYVERTRRAAQLFKEGRAPEIILTDDGERAGWSSEQQRNPPYAELAVGELRGAGVPAERIVVVPLPQEDPGTFDESTTLREYATAHGLRSLLAVTSPYHSRRALWTLRRVFQGSGVEVGLDAVEPGEQSPAPSVWWLHARGWRVVTTEYPKLVYYRLRY